MIRLFIGQEWNIDRELTCNETVLCNVIEEIIQKALQQKHSHVTIISPTPLFNELRYELLDREYKISEDIIESKSDNCKYKEYCITIYDLEKGSENIKYKRKIRKSIEQKLEQRNLDLFLAGLRRN